MRRARTLLILALALALAVAPEARAFRGPDTVVVRSGALALHALLWRPDGRGPFPAVLFNHGNGHTMEPQKPAALGPVFARHGYVFLFLYRRGSGLSSDQGTCSCDLMDREFAAHGQEGRNRLLLKLLETDHMNDALAGLAFLRALPGVDARRVAVAGHSFGGSLTLLVAERDSLLRAAVLFSGSAVSWEKAPQLRARLLAAVDRTRVPVFFIHAANDFSVAPGQAIAAEMARLGKPHRLEIYPPVGKTADEGHQFVYLDVPAWEPDVFAFLDPLLRR
jgi:dienelactone hydrolase